MVSFKLCLATRAVDLFGKITGEYLSNMLAVISQSMVKEFVFQQYCSSQQFSLVRSMC